MQTIIKETISTKEREVIGTRQVRGYKQAAAIREELIKLNQAAAKGTIYYAE